MQRALNLSFCGCGFLGMYHLGVAASLLKKGGPLMACVSNVAGASAGALAAALVVTANNKVAVESSASHIQDLAKEIRLQPLGALTPGYSFTKTLRNIIEDVLPQNAHLKANGKLHVSLTNITTRKNELMSDFRSKDELVDALIASCYIPLYAGINLPSIRGNKFMDGGLTDNLPQFQDGRTITISPFDGKSDIQPDQGEDKQKKKYYIHFHNQDLAMNLKNIKLFNDAFFPPKQNLLHNYFVQGMNDANRFLVKERLLENMH